MMTLFIVGYLKMPWKNSPQGLTALTRQHAFLICGEEHNTQNGQLNK